MVILGQSRGEKLFMCFLVYCFLSGPVLRDTARLSQRYPTPVLHAARFLVCPIGCDAPSPFSERFPPWRACEVEVRYPPPPNKRGISAILPRYAIKQGKTRAIPPLPYYLKEVSRDMGGVSRTGPLSVLP